MIKETLRHVLAGKITDNKSDIKKIVEVLFLAQNLLDKHNLSNVEIRLTSNKRVLGVCVGNGEIISLQINHIIRDSVERITDTILHEIAHCLTAGEGHNVVWQAKALELGLPFKHINRYKQL